MAASTNTPGIGQDAGATAIGGAGSNADNSRTGATPAHDSFAETGGSGGAGLTHSHGDDPDALQETAQDKAAAKADGDTDSDLQSGSRGALDTRPEQGGGTGTGLGSRETGANQSRDDLPPP